MNAERQPHEPAVMLPRLFDPDQPTDAMPCESLSESTALKPARSISPGRIVASPTLEAWETAALSEAAARHVPSEMRDEYASATTLPQFYSDCNGPHPRWDRLGRKSRKSSTAEKDSTALAHWVAATRPEAWRGNDWGGPSLDFLSKASLDWYGEQIERFVSVCGLARTSVNGLASSLRTILNHAVRVAAIPQVAKLPNIKEGQRLAKIYSATQIEQTVESLLRPTTLLGASEFRESIAVAFLLAIRTGLRAVDLFGLTREQFSRDVSDRITLNLLPKKNEEYDHKQQSIPLSPTTWSMLDLHCPPSGRLFPLLTSEDAEDPEKSAAATQRTKTLKQILGTIGITFRCPWHACRATCNETLESIKEGVGQFVLGHAKSGVNARSYRHPTKLVFDTINGVSPLRCECRLAGTLIDVTEDTYCGIG